MHKKTDSRIFVFPKTIGILNRNGQRFCAIVVNIEHTHKLLNIERPICCIDNDFNAYNRF